MRLLPQTGKRTQATGAAPWRCTRFFQPAQLADKTRGSLAVTRAICPTNAVTIAQPLLKMQFKSICRAAIIATNSIRRESVHECCEFAAHCTQWDPGAVKLTLLLGSPLLSAEVPHPPA
jgi:hypothetical protein